MSIEDRDWYRESYKQKHSGGRGSRGSGQKIAPAVLILLIAYGIFIYTFYFPGNHFFLCRKMEQAFCGHTGILFTTKTGKYLKTCAFR